MQKQRRAGRHDAKSPGPETRSMNNVKPTLIVTRHEHLVTVLRERGIVDNDTPVLTHVDTPEQVEGKHVIGVLPHHLSARAASVTEIPMRWSQQDREAMSRGDVDLDGTHRAAGDPITYVVQPIHGGGIDRTRPRWLAIARAYEHVERYGTHFGAGPHATPTTWQYKGLPVLLVWDATQQYSAYVIPSRGVWKPDCKGQWLDGYGVPVLEDTIAPAAGWADAPVLTTPPSLSRAEIEQVNGTLLNIVGRVLKMKRIRHDIGAQESDDQYRARLLAELDRRGCTGVQLGV